MNYLISLGVHLRRHGLTLLALVAILAAMLPTAAFAAGLDAQALGAPQASTGRYDRWRNNDNWEGHHSNWDRSRDRRGNPSWDRDGGQWHNRCDATYRVRRGDTLSEIARHYRVNLRSLMNANNLRNPNRIFAGQVLCIP
jgi:nucleoid-associated protein YgaU